jgi:undecaprenyl-diphosphatase
VARFRPQELVPVFTWITALGVGNVVAPLLLIALGGVWLTRGRWLAASLLVSAGGTAVFNTLGKLAFQRPRPVEAVLLEHSYSFPSGHAAIALGFYGFLGYLLIRSAESRRARVNLLLSTFVFALLIGLSRLVLGVHYLSDVWAGYLVGAGWLTIAIAISEWATVHGHIDWHASIESRTRRATWLLTSVGVLWYLGYAASWHPKLFTPPPTEASRIEKPLAEFLRRGKLVHTETVLGAQSQPLSIAFVAPRQAALVHLLKRAGWQPADPAKPASLLRLLKQGMAYTRAPLAPVFWNGRINDLGFERQAEVGGEKVIDTLRIWKADWLVGSSPVYVGVTRTYTGMYWGVLHAIAPDTDATLRRTLLSFDETSPKPTSCTANLGKAEIGVYLMGMPFFSGGKMGLVDLRDRAGVPLCATQPSGAHPPGTGAESGMGPRQSEKASSMARPSRVSLTALRGGGCQATVLAR